LPVEIARNGKASGNCCRWLAGDGLRTTVGNDCRWWWPAEAMNGAVRAPVEVDMDETKAQIEELAERLAVVEDVCRLLVQKAQELEAATVQTHERLSLAEACWERARDLLRVMAEALEALLRRAGGRPPSAPPPLSGLN
jgi:hypothetical protein